ncbi:MAG: InlB B-repeat-containing protein, partial [Oscillospiraceae bacterium]|nr:InlB B-repeat-containing protein [Oscillospiraceae bacterium]
MKTRLLSIITCLALCLSLLPTEVFAAEGTTYVVNENLTFESALEQAQDGDTIELSGSYEILTTPETDGTPFVIDKAVTITGGTLTLRRSGIVLGADVTFQDMTLHLSHDGYDAIFANGHTLTIRNVVCAGKQADLFGGHLYTVEEDENGTPIAVRAGTHGKIIIEGTNTGFGNIYAGSMNGSFDCPVMISLSSDIQSGGTIGTTVYASGALDLGYDPYEMLNPYYQSPSPVASKDYPVKQPVQIEIKTSAAVFVDGATGTTNNANVVYQGSEYLSTGLTMNHVASLNVLSGELQPAALNQGVDISVAAGATLDLSTVGTLTVNNFTGSDVSENYGTLVLGADQKLTINGEVTGTTLVDVQEVDTQYIEAIYSTDNNFKSANGWIVLTRDEMSGIWTAETAPETVTSLELTNIEVQDSDNLSVAALPAEVVYCPENGVLTLDYVPVEIYINDKSTDRSGDGEYDPYCYVQEELGLKLNFGWDGDDFALIVTPVAEEKLPVGKFTISVIIPAECTTDGQEITAEAVLMVRCDHELTYSWGSGDEMHTVYCPICPYEFEEPHTRINGTCTMCGHVMCYNLSVRSFVEGLDEGLGAVDVPEVYPGNVILTFKQDGGEDESQEFWGEASDLSVDAAYGQKIIVSAEPLVGYRLKNVELEGASFDETDGTYSFTMPANDVTVRATFERISYQITVEVTGNDAEDAVRIMDEDDNPIKQTFIDEWFQIKVRHKENHVSTVTLEIGGKDYSPQNSHNDTNETTHEFRLNKDDVNDIGDITVVVAYEACEHPGITRNCYEESLMEVRCEECFTKLTPLHDPVYTPMDGTNMHLVSCESCDYSFDEEHNFEDGRCICGAEKSDDGEGGSDTPVTRTFTVTFESNGGTSVEKQEVTENGKAAEPTAPTKDGYEFLGWYVEGAEEKYDFDTPVTGNLTLTAKWEQSQTPDPEPDPDPEPEPEPEPNTFTVTFDTDGGSAVAEQNVEEGGTVNVPIAPTKAGY